MRFAAGVRRGLQLSLLPLGQHTRLLEGSLLQIAFVSILMCKLKRAIWLGFVVSSITRQVLKVTSLLASAPSQSAG